MFKVTHPLRTRATWAYVPAILGIICMLLLGLTHRATCSAGGCSVLCIYIPRLLWNAVWQKILNIFASETWWADDEMRCTDMLVVGILLLPPWCFLYSKCHNIDRQQVAHSCVLVPVDQSPLVAWDIYATSCSLFIIGWVFILTYWKIDN